jgi:hypothetical protein
MLATGDVMAVGKPLKTLPTSGTDAAAFDSERAVEGTGRVGALRMAVLRREQRRESAVRRVGQARIKRRNVSGAAAEVDGIGETDELGRQFVAASSASPRSPVGGTNMLRESRTRSRRRISMRFASSSAVEPIDVVEPIPASLSAASASV